MINLDFLHNAVDEGDFTDAVCAGLLDVLAEVEYLRAELIVPKVALPEAESLNAIKARLAAATPGPWHVDRKHANVVYDVADNWGTQTWSASNRHYNNGDPLTDAEFIAHAPEDIAALLAEVEHLRAELTSSRIVSIARGILVEHIEHLQAELAAERQSSDDARDILLERIQALEKALPEPDDLDEAASCVWDAVEPDSSGSQMHLGELAKRLRESAGRIREVRGE